MKKSLAILAAILASLSASMAETGAPAESPPAIPVAFRTEYKSPNRLDTGYYSFEGAFVNRLPEIRVSIEAGGEGRKVILASPSS
jgi:hypothetical protein